MITDNRPSRSWQVLTLILTVLGSLVALLALSTMVCGQVAVGVALPQITLLRVSVGVAPVAVQPVPVVPVQPPPLLQLPEDFPPGTLIVTRNWYEPHNTAPGWLNHNATAVGNGYIVESMEGIGVRRVPVSDLANRGYSHIGYMTPRDPLYGAIWARRAEYLVGLPYARFSSLWPVYGPLRLRMGINCVSVTEFTYCVSGLTTADDSLRLQYGYLNPIQWVPVAQPLAGGPR